MRSIILFSISFFCWEYALAQNVFIVSNASVADVNVFEVRFESLADLKVFSAESSSQAWGNNGRWFFVNHIGLASKTVCFVDNPTTADVLIYYVKYPVRAGWIDQKKVHFFL